ncbi:hypothetical protein [Sporolactobacillus sp. KGMB 08714]|uniref:hypothetical protein n=1 Tax=Sporolactobacillus sp. KGMB 08714 TaxID=3064704 RepID=UPI002FBE09B5
MSHFIDSIKYLIFLFCWKIAGFWKKLWFRKKSETDAVLPDQQAEIVLINIDQYRSLFAAPTAHPEIFMPKPVFEKIIRTLPANYVIPDLAALKKVIEAYHRPPAPEIQRFSEGLAADYRVLEKIKSSLPADYIFPLPVNLKTNQPAQPTISAISTIPAGAFPAADPDQAVHTDTGIPGLITLTIPAAPAEALSNQKIMKPVSGQENAGSADDYKFVFLK